MRFHNKFATSAGLIAAAILGLAQFSSAGKIDAVSGASLKISGGTTTQTSATLNFTFGDADGDWTLYYDVVDHTSTSAFPNKLTKTIKASANSFTATGLKPGTKYFYWLQGTWSGKTTYKHTAATVWTTDAATSVLHVAPKLEATRSYVDPLGRRIQVRAPVGISSNGVQVELTDGHR